MQERRSPSAWVCDGGGQNPKTGRQVIGTGQSTSQDQGSLQCRDGDCDINWFGLVHDCLADLALEGLQRTARQTNTIEQRKDLQRDKAVL